MATLPGCGLEPGGLRCGTEFRFPKTAAVRMTIILAGVRSAIQTGEAIPARFGALDVLPAVLVGLAMFYAAQD